MERKKARSQTLKQFHKRRKQLVRLHKQGNKVMQSARQSYATVCVAIDLFDAGDWSAVRLAPRSRAKGDGRVLSSAQEEAIQRMIIDKRPEEFEMHFHLWSRLKLSWRLQRNQSIVCSSLGAPCRERSSSA